MLRRFNVPRNFALKRTFSFHDKRKSTQKENRWNRMLVIFSTVVIVLFLFKPHRKRKRTKKKPDQLAGCTFRIPLRTVRM
jgi:hypothetical protein